MDSALHRVFDILLQTLQINKDKIGQRWVDARGGAIVYFCETNLMNKDVVELENKHLHYFDGLQYHAVPIKVSIKD